MKSIIFFTFFAFLLSIQVNAANYSIPESIFVNEGKTDFNNIFITNESELNENVNQLFDDDVLNHEYSKAFDLNSKFVDYWLKQKQFWHLIDLNHDGVNEMFYSNDNLQAEDISFEIYVKANNKYVARYFEKGKLIAYKIHPKTNEIILFRHQYPCCSNISHNIEMVRFLNNNFHLRKKYFVARPDEMKTKLFPSKVNYKSNYHYLKEESKIRWSAEVIKEKAARTSNENVISKFPKGSVYKVLSIEKGWKYVLMCSEPSKETNRIINPANFVNTHIYGWIK